MSKSQKIREHLQKHPSAKISTMAKQYGCSRQLVHNVIRLDRLNRAENNKAVPTPTLKVDNARTTPQIKSVKISRSFLWGAIKYERYE